MSKQWWSRSKGLVCGPFNSREEAAERMFTIKGKQVTEVMTGYGTVGPDFNIQWLSREDFDAKTRR